MPQVFLTEQQRLEARYAKMLRCVGDHLAKMMNREKLNRGQMCKRLGISHETLNRILSGGEVKMSTVTFVRLLDMARIDLKARPDELEA